MTELDGNGLVQGLERSDWKGSWIWSDNGDNDRNVYVLFRRVFEAADSGFLQLAITADSHYSLTLDGAFIARGPARAPLAYYLYDTLTLPISPGRHCLGVIVHHIGEINATVMTGRPGFLADVELDIRAGARDLSTGPEWKCRVSDAWRKDLPSTMSHFGFWEDCELARLPEGWMKPDFPDADWAVPVAVGKPPCAPWPRLIARDIPMPAYVHQPSPRVVAVGAWEEGVAESPTPSVQAAGRRRLRQAKSPDLPFPVALPGAGRGAYITLDFGRTVSGYVEVAWTKAQAGMQLDISYDEMLTPEGAVNPERSYAHLTDRYRLGAGPGRVRNLHPRGFRYVTLDLSGAGDVVISAVTAVEETYPFVRQSSFISPDGELMTFFAKGAETVRICTTDAFTDCPTRERVQWMEDLYMHARVAAYAFGDTRMLRHALFQAAQGALPDGRINGFFPSERVNCAFAAGSLSWLHLLVDYWLQAGDEDLRRLLPTAAKLLACLETQTDESGLVVKWPAGQFWDWAPLETSGCLLLTNAMYAWALARLAEHPVFGQALGGDLAARAARVRQAAHDRFWDASRSLYRDMPPDDPRAPLYSQQANTMAVLAGICPPESRQALLRRLIDPDQLGPVPAGEESLNATNRRSPDQLIPMGTLWFGHFLCQALFEAGLDREALAQMRAYWGAYAELPTFPETRLQRGNTGHCHGWASGPAFLLPAYVLGVQPVDRGWATVRVAPHPGDLTAARGVFSTPRGPLIVAWNRVGGRIDLKVDAPEGVRIIREVRPAGA